MSNAQLSTPPPPHPTYTLTYPRPHTLLITISRPKAMNSLPYASHWEADSIISWFEKEPSLRVCVITGSGNKAFCAGQDLIEQSKIREAARKAEEEQAAKKVRGSDADIGAGAGVGERAGVAEQKVQHSGNMMPPRQMLTHPASGFMGVSRRHHGGKKPILAAVNGFAYGGGFEIVLGCDMIVASPSASFALPEASRGLYAAAGGLSKLVRLVGLPVATEVAITGRILSAREAADMRIINRVSGSEQSCLEETLDLAEKIGTLSPDAVIVSKHGLRMALEEGSVEQAAQRTDKEYGEKLREGDNIRIGLKAFAEKKRPQWVPSKL